jgi:S-adenosylmethionine:tRNA ribosyltransferase-isomerase
VVRIASVPAAPYYDLPDERIAREPATPRDAARLLVDRGPGREPLHRRVADLPDVLLEGDVVVVNETRVLPARLRLRKETGGAVEVVLLDAEGPQGTWTALVRPSAKVPEGTELRAGDDLVVEVGERLAEGRRRVRLVADDPAAALARHGDVPLPPYLGGLRVEPERYQTVYARVPGSVAAPTAGLHLTQEVLDRLRARGIEVLTVDLAVGLDTFRPVTAERLEDHPVHTERYRVPPATMDACRQARRVVAVGTTTVRALESAAATNRFEGRTSLLIKPGHRWRVVSAMLTNFHQPFSTPLLLVEALVGPRWRDLYATALEGDYRFLSFGDAMLLQHHPAL